jgi:hypothetical protein
MFRVVLPPIIGSAYNSIYSIWYLSHRYCYLTLSCYYIVNYVIVSVPLLDMQYTETFHTIQVMLGIQVHASKKYYTDLLGNYKMVEEGGKREL